MTQKHRPENLGTPVAADLAAVEQELSSYWKEALEEKDGAVMRACSCNLIVIVEDRQEAESLPAVVGKVAESHPCRAITAYQEPEEAGDGAPMQAWVLVQCSLPFAGGPQVCSELITIGAFGRAGPNLPNTLLSLLVPDLPVYLYWRSLKLADRELADQMTRFSHMMIVDSHASKDDLVNRERLLELLTASPRDIHLRDLNWSRLTAWRDLIAQFFDAPASRPLARLISEVEVRRVVAYPGNIPTRTLLLTGWLATRLGWKRISAVREGREWISRWDSAEGEVLVRFLPIDEPSGRQPGIQSVTLKTRPGDVFTVVLEPELSCMTAVSECGGTQLRHSVPYEPLDEPSLLVEELSLSGEDPGFLAALGEALELEKSFLRDRR